MPCNINFSFAKILELIPQYKAGTLTAKEMVEAMQQKVKEIDALIASKQLHRQMLIDHIAWFKSRKRKSK
jgi:hypothetical protein